MDRKLLLVFALTFLVMLLFQPLLKKFGPQPVPAKPQTQNQPAPVAPSPGQANPAAMAAPATAQAAVPASAKQASTESETVIENDIYKIRFTNRGGLATSWILKKYTDDKGQPLELINGISAPKYGYPLSLWIYDQPLRDKVNNALFVPSSAPKPGAPPDLTYEWSDATTVVRKTFHFDSSYVIGVEVSVQDKGAGVAALPTWPSGFGDANTASLYAGSRIEYQLNDKTERLAIKKISNGNTLPGPFNWAGVVDQYFAAVFIPEDARNGSMVTLRNPIDVPRDPKNPANGQTIKEEVLGAAVGNLQGLTVSRLYVGPKALAVVESVHVPTIVGAEQDLRTLVNFGFFGIIARPLFLWLKWTYNHMVANWGWAIVIQTLIINVALLPLRISQMKSMLKMQKVGPQIKSIQEKYKKYSLRDPRKAAMNEEIAALYKKEGVNPAGGCLPLVIQMPFLFAYYAMLGVAIDLRHAPWLWIRDLSSPDPWHLLPVGIIITMLIMQRMTPQAGMDPQQQKMMNFMMPVFLGVMSWNLASGLCLYWAEGQVVGIAQQLVLNRSSLGREMREMMEKRARKKEK
jgi:YidC/Oxa1 family membrane protein insertase